MFYVSKQQIYNALFAVALVFCVAVNFFPKPDSVETAAIPVNGKVIIVDAGHGSPDGGAVGLNGSIEKDLNLQVAKKLGSYLEQSGAYVVYTRYDDNSIADNIGGSLREIKINDLNKRREIKNTSDADLFVSIHMNKFDDSRYKGAQVFYANSAPQSKLLAEKIQNNIKAFADCSNTRNIKGDNNSIYILKNSSIPSVVVECGFLSNEEDEAKLNTEQYRDKMAFAVFAGITEYISQSQSR